jgi:hypothetical protein
MLAFRDGSKYLFLASVSVHLSVALVYCGGSVGRRKESVKHPVLEPHQLFFLRQPPNQHPKMGRDFLSQAFAPVSAVPSSERAPATTSQAPRMCSREREPRRWCSKDAIWPEDEEWWSSQDVVYEAFVDGPLPAQAVDHSQAAAHETVTVNHLEETLLRRFSTYERENGIQQTASSPTTAEAPTVMMDAHTLPSARDTISEEELDNVALDFVVCDHRDEDDEDEEVGEDFELDWDDEHEMGEDMDSEMQDETPPPSTPVAQARPLPVPGPTPAHCPPATPPATPRSIHVLARVPSTPILTPRSLSIARMRGFTVHSPRTEVVL